MSRMFFLHDDIDESLLNLRSKSLYWHKREFGLEVTIGGVFSMDEMRSS